MRASMRIVCNVDRTKYRAKPNPEQVRKIQCNLEKSQEIEALELFNVICSGGSFRAAAIRGNSDSGFISQQIFAVDIDNAKGKEPIPESSRLTPEQAVEKARAAGLTANFIYPTFSDSLALRKFRILFLLDMPITDLELRHQVADYVTNIFGAAADSKCRNPARLFFGTDKPSILTNTEKINSIEKIMPLLPKTPKIKAPSKKMEQRKRGTLYDKPKKAHSISNIDLIRMGNIEELKNRLGSSKTRIFDNSEDFLKYVYSELDIAELLEIDTPKSFCCIFHADEHPSASIFRDKYGNQRYKCNSTNCDVNMNVKQIIEALQDARSEYRAFEFIKAIYNLKVKETAWSKEQTANIDSIISCMTSAAGNSFSEICPTAAKTTRNATLIYLQTLNIARNNIFPEPIENSEQNIIFTMSIRQLAKAAGKSSIDKVSKYVKMLIYHGMLEIVPDSEIPQRLLNRANAKRTGEKHCHTNFYRIPSWVYRRTQFIEAQGKRWKNQNYRLNGISYELFFRNEGAAMAKKLYPQTATFTTKAGKEMQRTTTRKSNEMTLLLSGIVLEQIQKLGYTTEANVINEAGSRTGYKMADIQLKRSINEILDSYGLKKIRANKAIKEQYKIISNGYPLIIVEDV